MHKFNKGDNIKPIDKCLGESRTICDVCDGYYITNKGILDFEFEDNWEVDEADWLKELKDIPKEKVQQSIDDIINSIPCDPKIQYASIDAAIKAHAEDYSFNIESELFNQLTPEQQKLWRKEIEQACISGGYGGLDLGRDKRYEENKSPIDEDLDALVLKLEGDIGTSEWSRETIKEYFEKVAALQRGRDAVIIINAKEEGVRLGKALMKQEIAKDNLLLPFKEYDNLIESIEKRKKEGYEAGFTKGLEDSKNE